MFNTTLRWIAVGLCIFTLCLIFTAITWWEYATRAIDYMDVASSHYALANHEVSGYFFIAMTAMTIVLGLRAMLTEN